MNYYYIAICMTIVEREKMGKEKNNLDIKRNDLIASGLKSTLGAIPYLGPFISEIVGSVIPNQRIDRIASLLKALEAKIDPEEKAKVDARILEEKSVDLMEDGFLQAARALSEERIDYIASLLKNSLTDEDLEQIAYKKLLSILSELNDAEVLLLKFHTRQTTWGWVEKFRSKHPGVLSDPMYLRTSQKEVEKHAICEAYTINLSRLGLIKSMFNRPWKDELPELDEQTGMMKSSGYYITDLGRLLLRSIDQDEED